MSKIRILLIASVICTLFYVSPVNSNSNIFRMALPKPTSGSFIRSTFGIISNDASNAIVFRNQMVGGIVGPLTGLYVIGQGMTPDKLTQIEEISVDRDIILDASILFDIGIAEIPEAIENGVIFSMPANFKRLVRVLEFSLFMTAGAFNGIDIARTGHYNMLESSEMVPYQLAVLKCIFDLPYTIVRKNVANENISPFQNIAGFHAMLSGLKKAVEALKSGGGKEGPIEILHLQNAMKILTGDPIGHNEIFKNLASDIETNFHNILAYFWDKRIELIGEARKTYEKLTMESAYAMAFLFQELGLRADFDVELILKDTETWLDRLTVNTLSPSRVVIVDGATNY